MISAIFGLGPPGVPQNLLPLPEPPSLTQFGLVPAQFRSEHRCQPSTVTFLLRLHPKQKNRLFKRRIVCVSPSSPHLPRSISLCCFVWKTSGRARDSASSLPSTGPGGVDGESSAVRVVTSECLHIRGAVLLRQIKSGCWGSR